MDPQLVEVRKRLYNDFQFYAKHALKIRTKSGTVAPLVLNQPQTQLHDLVEKQLAAEGRVRVIILKARQQGISTYVGGRLYWKTSQNSARRTMVVAHKADSTQTLFDMTQRYHEQCPQALRPQTKYSSRREIVFNKLDSSYVVATAGGEGIARSETITDLHASEIAFWPSSTARETWNGLRQTVPDMPGTEIYIESTANGVANLFHELWKGACDGTNGYIPVFIPWFAEPLYADAAPDDFEPTPDELDLIAEHQLTYEQLQWRRRKIAENSLDLFKQEYPAYPEEAFLTTGRPVFNPETLTQRQKELRSIRCDRCEIIAAKEGPEVHQHPRGELLVYHGLDPAETYYIGADVGKGIKHGDYSTACVLDSKKRQVSQWRGHIHPDAFAHVLNALGLYYNEARLTVEANDHGILTCHILAKELFYPNLYTEVQHDKVDDKETVRLGFTTNVKTKPLIIDGLRASMRKGEIELNDDVTINEMLTFVFTESGRMEAEEGCHDDTVIALALANYTHEGQFVPIANQDSYYIEAI